MPKKVVPLSDKSISNAKPKDKEYTKHDGDGLYLLIKPNGSKLWRFQYTYKGKRYKASFKPYPELTLTAAREKRREWLEKIANGINPLQEIKEKEQQKESDIKGQFHLVVKEWADSLDCTPKHAQRKYRTFETAMFPYFCTYDKGGKIVSSRHIRDIEHNEVLAAIDNKKIASAETAKKMYYDCKHVWEHAISKGYTDTFVIAKIAKKQIPKVTKKHYPKITDNVILKELLQKIDGYGSPVVRCLLKFVAYIPLRAENLCALRWQQIDFEQKLIIIPRAEMKVKDPELPDFKMPLPLQAIRVLDEVRPFTGWSPFVFCGLNNPNQSMNPATPNKALRSLGFDTEETGRKQTLHSFRGTFRSLAETHHKEHGARFEVMEKALDHHEGSKTVRAYAHQADFTEQMRPLMEWWGDFLDTLKSN